MGSNMVGIPVPLVYSLKIKRLDKSWEKGDPDQPNARSIYVETYDGIIRIIQTLRLHLPQ